MIADYWPLAGLTIRTPRLELRLPNDEELVELGKVATKGVHLPGEQPFMSRWAEGSPMEIVRTVMQNHWRRLGTWSTDRWALALAVYDVRTGHPLGTQELRAEKFSELREVETASWLGLDYQRRGYGTEMRAAVLHLAFAGLGASYALSSSFTENESSQSVSRKLGYQPDGVQRDVCDNRVLVSRRFRLSRDEWQRTERPDVTVSGLAPCLSSFGATTSRATRGRIG